MFFIRLKIILLSIIILSGFSFFLLYKLDSYVKNQAVSILSSQLSSITDFIFDTTHIVDNAPVHNLALLDTIKNQSNMKDLWISRNDKLSDELGKQKTSLRDVIERKTYVTRIEEHALTKIDNTNNQDARISVPINTNESCLTCHTGLKVGDVAGSVNARFTINDSIMAIYDTMKVELMGIILIASIILMIVMMFSVNSFTKLVYSMKIAIQSAIEGNFSIRIKSQGIGIFSEATKLANKLLEVLDKSITSIDKKIATIFIYKKNLYSKNPLIRITELIAELTNLFLFKNKIETARANKEVYRELQAVISKYIKYRYMIFAEIINNEIVSGYKLEGETEMKISTGDVRGIEKRLENPNPNILFNDEKGCLFISTSIEQLNVIDLKIFISQDIVLYYSIMMNSKKELLEKENSISRIYNYIREARPIIKNIILVKNIEEASYSDPLTKAYNRLYLEKYALSAESKLQKHINFGVLMLDIDHFKKVNDTYGHAVGDAGIVLLTETVKKCIKPTDKLFRYGGEEFVVILEGYDIDETQRIAEKIRNMFAMAKRCSLMELNFQKSVSIGMSAMPDFSRNVWECINQADLALYEAKETGRNKVVKYSLKLKLKDEQKKAKEAQAMQNPTNSNEIDVENDDEAAFLESLKLNR
ncbi:hypothetical protein CCY99_00865 [Helicobacter sp. 16-1353]|uniref:GGDEF domain-containing protein n=1 Tax=Helicobacter sp. 16-1353 TaxID=2004996 RepID=UPI000DCF4844|nr:GGDEF domain-containing protein [Helicobacter sp. 16-1353]RAX55283.1 hypothetical protein CCY99_00865 [Helicobacter sp. 16-1353]